LHNNNSKRRAPLSLLDQASTTARPGLTSACSSPKPDPTRNTPASTLKGSINYPDGFVSADKQWLHFAYDDARHRAVR
jgi:hypothetical protein